MDYFPIFYKLKKQHCLVVGAGEVAARKIELLLRAGAFISVVAPEISASVIALSEQHPLNIVREVFDNHDIDCYTLIVCATNDFDTNAMVAKKAHAHRIPVNVVDTPELCSFIFPAIVDRSPITIAISSGGEAPVLSRLLRAKIETAIPPAYGVLANLASRFRNNVKNLIPQSMRRRFWENILQGHVAELVFSGNLQKAESMLIEEVNRFGQSPCLGEVYLIGAGPGAPDLLTFRALRLLQQADVVVYDRLVSPEILDLARRDSEKMYVGKQRKHHALEQGSINQLLSDLALSGKRVARLKGGDPFIFGRGGEEIETLMEQGIPFQVVPGITAASGCASYAGIPLTHRDFAQSCIFVTGHLKDNSVNLDWTQLSLPNQTIVIYMGLVGLEQICESLIAHGSPVDLPIALVQQGTTNNQKVVSGTLSTLPNLVRNEEIKAPTIIIIGHVVKLHDKLKWYGNELFNNGKLR